MITFCASGDFLIHIPIPENHAGADALASQIKKADVELENGCILVDDNRKIAYTAE